MASMALVADYGASSSDSDQDEGEEAVFKSCVKTDQLEAVSRTYQGGVNLLTNSSDSDESENDDEVTPSPVESQEKLPLPDIFSTSSGDSSKQRSSSSIYANPFKDQEDAKTSILEQHVKLSTVERQEAKQKKVCYKFLKGKCRFGDKCKFVHSGGGGSSISSGRGPVLKFAPAGTAANAMQFDNEAFNNSAGDDEDVLQNQKRKRAGLGNTLVPPKKAMKAYNKQQRDERPWMNS
ncbi:uncharacterized protein [Ptychodera flava]|uniref:uncharacterized protein n=1 Tax=Ptychodera flava TaxID=63121 RepID=UPI00396AAEFF